MIYQKAKTLSLSKYEHIVSYVVTNAFAKADPNLQKKLDAFPKNLLIALAHNNIINMVT